nr:MAG TPA: hypothetical protein [Caudoviricetes sp.]
MIDSFQKRTRKKIDGLPYIKKMAKYAYCFQTFNHENIFII